MQGCRSRCSIAPEPGTTCIDRFENAKGRLRGAIQIAAPEAVAIDRQACGSDGRVVPAHRSDSKRSGVEGLALHLSNVAWCVGAGDWIMDVYGVVSKGRFVPETGAAASTCLIAA